MPADIVATYTPSQESDQNQSATRRTMPLCRYPDQAHYRGNGNIDDAASWVCPPNRGLLKVAWAGTHAGL